MDAKKSDANATTLTPAQVFGRRVKEAREAKGWKQGETADRLLVDRTTYNKIEKGVRGDVKISQLFEFAVRLGMSPLHLITPREDEQMIAVTPQVELPAAAVREWVRGSVLLPSSDPATFFASLPISEQRDLLRKVLPASSSSAPLLTAITGSVPDEDVDRALRAIHDKIGQSKEEHDA
jgi:transcriptional regulator with XRE-family HTH domain